MFKRSCAAVVSLLMLGVMTGCAIQAPVYQPSLDNVESWKKTGTAVAIGAFTVQAGAEGAQSISLRGNPMQSPVGGDYAAYIAEALRQELLLAGRLNPQSRAVISGLLLRNDIAAGGITTNSGEIEMRFSVRVDGSERYAKTLRSQLSWDSSFVGAVAIPKAQQQYPQLVQKLVSQLLADQSFLNSLR